VVRQGGFISAGFLVVGYCGLAACTNFADDSDQKDSADTSASPLGAARPDGNGLDTYKLTAAALLANRTIVSQLVSHSLTRASLTTAVYNEICNADHNSHEVFRYLVKCALATSHDIAINCAHVGWLARLRATHLLLQLRPLPA
jgi:hypothetical protein